MPKLTLDDLANLDNPTTAVSALNSNNDKIEAALENTLSRDGTSPNSMGASLDMNSNRILNLPAPVSGAEPVRLQDIPGSLGDLTAALAAAEGFADAAEASADAAAATLAFIEAAEDGIYDYIDAEIAAIPAPTVADGSITLAKLASNSVNASKIVDGSVETAKLASYAVDYTKLKTDTYTDLKDIRNVLRIGHAWDLYDLGLVPATSAAATTNTTRFNAGITAMRLAGVHRLIVPPGNWYINDTINVDYPLSIEGVHRLLSGITSLSINNILSFTGTYGTGGGIKDISTYYDLTAYAPGTIGGVAIYAYTATGSVGAHGIIIERVRTTVGSNNMYYYGILLNGAANTSGTPGIRDCIVRDCDVFQITSGGASVDIRQGRSVMIDNVNAYATGPTSPISYLSISGPNGTYPSSGVKVVGGNFATVIVDHANQCSISSYVGTSGDLTANSSTSLVVQHGVAWTNAGTGNKLL